MKPSYLGDDSTGFEDDGTGDDWSNVHKSAVKRPQYSVLDSRQNEAAQQHSSDALHWEVRARATYANIAIACHVTSTVDNPARPG